MVHWFTAFMWKALNLHLAFLGEGFIYKNCVTDPCLAHQSVARNSLQDAKQIVETAWEDYISMKKDGDLSYTFLKDLKGPLHLYSESL